MMTTETLSDVSLINIIETHALPVLGAWIASEILGVSKETKYNGLVHLTLGLIHTVARELTMPKTRPLTLTPTPTPTHTPTPKPTSTPTPSPTSDEQTRT